MDTDIIAACLELVAEPVGDPASLVFQRLLAENPEIEALSSATPAASCGAR